MFFSISLIILGLAFFETISSVDNAIINAEVLSTMNHRARRWFLTWGMLIAVFIIRGLLPLGIIWVFNPKLSAWQVWSAAWSADPLVLESIRQSTPILLALGGVFLIFIFFYWFFGKNKKQELPKAEKFFLLKGKNDLSKLLFLEMIDFAFSIDGVLGAFAFTLSVPLILLGSGLGAFLVRQLTVSNIEQIKKYIYLKNGAMYSVFALGIIMLFRSFGFPIPEYASPLLTFIIVIFFFWKSKIILNKKNG